MFNKFSKSYSPCHFALFNLSPQILPPEFERKLVQMLHHKSSILVDNLSSTKPFYDYSLERVPLQLGFHLYFGTWRISARKKCTRLKSILLLMDPYLFQNLRNAPQTK